MGKGSAELEQISLAGSFFVEQIRTCPSTIMSKWIISVCSGMDKAGLA